MEEGVEEENIVYLELNSEQAHSLAMGFNLMFTFVWGQIDFLIREKQKPDLDEEMAKKVQESLLIYRSLTEDLAPINEDLITQLKELEEQKEKPQTKIIKPFDPH